MADIDPRKWQNSQIACTEKWLIALQRGSKGLRTTYAAHIVSRPWRIASQDSLIPIF